MMAPLLKKIIVITFLGVGAVLCITFFVYMYYYFRSLAGKGAGRGLQVVTRVIIGLFLVWLIVLLVGVWMGR
jgi:hypothetical protein